MVRHEGAYAAIVKATRKIRLKVAAIGGEKSFSPTCSDKMNFATEAESVDRLIQRRWEEAQPIANIVVPPGNNIRLNFVTDNINTADSFGAVAYPLLLTVLLARDKGFDVRIITRSSTSNPRNLSCFLNQCGLVSLPKIAYYSDYDRNYSSRAFKLEISEQDVFFASSWQSAFAIDQINRRERFFYYLGTPEPFLSPAGDERLRCEKSLANERIDYILNSKALFDYFRQTDRFSNIIRNGSFFEPTAIGRSAIVPEPAPTRRAKYRLCYYCSPVTAGNLFYTGLEYLDEAVTSGVIDKKDWDVYIVGTDIPNLKFSNGLKPIIKEMMPWCEYGEFFSRVDLSFCPEYSCFEGNAAIDRVCSGAVLLTNARWRNHSHEDFIIAELDSQAMRQGFCQAVERVRGLETAAQNNKPAQEYGDWEKDYRGILDYMDSRIQSR